VARWPLVVKLCSLARMRLISRSRGAAFRVRRSRQMRRSEASLQRSRPRHHGARGQSIKRADRHRSDLAMAASSFCVKSGFAVEPRQTCSAGRASRRRLCATPIAYVPEVTGRRRPEESGDRSAGSAAIVSREEMTKTISNKIISMLSIVVNPPRPSPVSGAYPGRRARAYVLDEYWAL